MMLLKKTVYDKLVAKVDNIDTSDFVLKTKYQTDKTDLKNKCPNMTDFVKKTKLTELENEISDISNLATKTALTTVENKIPSVSNLATKTALTTVENKIPGDSDLGKKQTITLKLPILKINLIITIMINILIFQMVMFLMGE